MDFEKIAKTPITEPFDRLVSIFEAHELAILTDPLGEYRKMCDFFIERINLVTKSAEHDRVFMVEVCRPDGKIDTPLLDTIRITKKEYDRLKRIEHAVEKMGETFGRG